MHPLTLAIALVTVLSAIAQPSTDTPARRPQGPPSSPEIHDDRKVTFRLRAPNASEVKVSGEWGGEAAAMSKDENGVWKVTIGPLDPELYGYSFLVDGLRIADPANSQLKPMRSPTTSVLEIRGNPPLIHDADPKVPRGAVTVHQYYSDALRAWRRVHIYTPPGYTESRRPYPVLYLFHGSGDNDATWSTLGRANVILDNLIAQKKSKPMIVVMPDGHPPTAGSPDAPRDEARRRNLEVFSEDILNEVIPLTEKNYRVRKNARSRAVAGLSMGGGQSINLGLNHPDKFGYVGGFSSAVRNPKEAEFAVFNSRQKPRLVWIAIGKDDFLIQNQRDFNENLKARNVKHEFLVTEGNHSWPVWRKYLAEFAPLLFNE